MDVDKQDIDIEGNADRYFDLDEVVERSDHN